MEVYNEGLKCRIRYANIYSETEFVLVVITVDGSRVNFYKNGVLQEVSPYKYAPATSSDCAYQIQVSEYPLNLGANHMGGTIKSFAVWDRALSGNEVAGLSGQLTCPSAEQ